MEVAVGKKLTDLNGNVLKNQDGTDSELKNVIIDALLATYKDEQGLTGEEKLSRWQLATKVKASDGVAYLDAEEVVLIKKLIGKAYSTVIVGQAWQILEGK